MTHPWAAPKSDNEKTAEEISGHTLASAKSGEDSESDTSDADDDEAESAVKRVRLRGIGKEGRCDVCGAPVDTETAVTTKACPIGTAMKKLGDSLADRNLRVAIDSTGGYKVHPRCWRETTIGRSDKPRFKERS